MRKSERIGKQAQLNYSESKRQFSRIAIMDESRDMTVDSDPTIAQQQQAQYEMHVQNQHLIQQLADQNQAITHQNQRMEQQMAEMTRRMDQLLNQVQDEQTQNRVLQQRVAELQPQTATTVSTQGTEPPQHNVSPLCGQNEFNLNEANIVGNGPSSGNINVSMPVAAVLQPATSSLLSSTLTHRPFELPEFSGLPEQWPVFIAAFKQSSEAFGYSALQNIFRLQKCLKGVAREAVEYLLISPENVPELISTLEFRFGRPEILARSQMTKVRDLPSICSSHSRLELPTW